MKVKEIKIHSKVEKKMKRQQKKCMNVICVLIPTRIQAHCITTRKTNIILTKFQAMSVEKFLSVVDTCKDTRVMYTM